MSHLHETQLVKLKNKDNSIPIDVNIVEIIRWLDSFQAVRTLYCCEGGNGSANEPYVLFTCKDQQELRKIIETVQYQYGDRPQDMRYYAKVAIDAPFWIKGEFRYRLGFLGIKNRNDFTKFLVTGIHSTNV